MQGTDRTQRQDDPATGGKSYRDTCKYIDGGRKPISGEGWTFVRQLPAWRGDARLYRLDTAVTVYLDRWDDEGEHYVQPLVFDHVVVSSVSDYFSNETYAFPADVNGEVLSWLELPGSTRVAGQHVEVITAFVASQG